MKLLGKLLGKHESSLPFVVVKISKLFLISLSADSNLFLAELMLRYPVKHSLEVHSVTPFKLEMTYYTNIKWYINQRKFWSCHSVKNVHIRSYSIRMRGNTVQNNSEYGHFPRKV